MNTKFIKPSDPKLKLREHPKDAPLPPDGAMRPMTAFWLRRLRDKDVVEATAPAAKGAAAATDTGEGTPRGSRRSNGN